MLTVSMQLDGPGLEGKEETRHKRRHVFSPRTVPPCNGEGFRSSIWGGCSYTLLESDFYFETSPQLALTLQLLGI